MNKSLSFIISLFSLVSFSQDIIKTIENEEILAKVEEINIDVIKYKKFNNLTGPDYFIRKSDVKKITYENGVIENYSKDFGTSIEDIKTILKVNIDKYAYERTGRSSIRLEFEDDFLRFYLVDLKNDDNVVKRDLYDLSGNCIFHEVSKRSNGFAFINAYVPRLLKSPENTWGNGYKLIIRIKGHEKADIILKALKRYHELLQNKSTDSD